MRLSSGLSLGDVASQACLERTYFSALFRRVYGQRYSQCITNERVDRAKTLLATSDLPIAEIARRVGYRDVRSLQRAFRRTREDPPSAVRRRLTRADGPRIEGTLLSRLDSPVDRGAESPRESLRTCRDHCRHRDDERGDRVAAPGRSHRPNCETFECTNHSVQGEST